MLDHARLFALNLNHQAAKCILSVFSGRQTSKKDGSRGTFLIFVAALAEHSRGEVKG